MKKSIKKSPKKNIGRQAAQRTKSPITKKTGPRKAPSPRNEISAKANPFAKTIRRARLAKEMTAEDLSKKVGVSAQCIVLWETRPKANIREKNIAPLAKALGIPIGKLARVVSHAKKATA